MAAIQAALHARAAASTTLTESVRELTRFKVKPSPSKRLLRTKLDTLVTNKQILIAKHYIYGEKASVDLQSAEMVDWLTPQLDIANDLADEVEIMIDDLDSNEDALQKQRDEAELQRALKNEVAVALLQYQSNEKTLRDRVALMQTIVDDESRTTDEDANLIRSHLKQVNDSFEEQIKSWNTFKSLQSVTEDELNRVFEVEEELKKLVADNCLAATAVLNKIDPETIVPLQHSSVSGSASVIDESSSSSSNKSLIKTEKMKHPTFSGDIRGFARFKSDFETITAPSYPDKDHQVYALKENCLKGEPRKLVANMRDLDEIWERLQDRYGDNLEIVNCVIKSIQSFKFVKNDHDKCMIRLVDELEKGVQDLAAIDAKHDIANAITVKILEEKLPRQFKDRWFLEDRSPSSNEAGDSVAASSRFDKLFEFLKRERKHAERMVLLSPNDPPKVGPKLPPHLAASADGGRVKSPTNKCLIHPNATHFTRNCKAFRAKDKEERGKLVKDLDACKLCLSISHQNNPCPFEATWGKCNINGCDQFHSHLVHGCTIVGIGCFAEICLSVSASQTLLLIQYVEMEDGSFAVVFWDGGSTLTLVSKDFAVRNQLRGVPILYDLITVGGVVTTRNTMLYELTIVASNGTHHLLQAFEIEEICGTLNAVNTEEFASQFPSTTPEEIARPAGKVDILIGNNYASIHPDKKHVNDGLVLYESQFGTGKILGGRHHNINESNTINPDAHRCAKAQVSNVRTHQERKPALDFFTTESLGIDVPINQRCRKCKFETEELSRIQQRELAVMRDSLTLDETKCQWTATYPCAVDPSVLKNNKTQAIALAEKTERRICKDPQLLQQYNNKFNDLIETNVMVEIPKEEEDNYTGPVYYVNHHEVLKPESSSTPFRLVINPSLKYHGVSPNDVWMKGPNALNHMFGILLRLRTHKIALIGDIKKMYNMIRTTPKEKHMRRVVWRYGKTGEAFKTYGIDVVMFGDAPAAAMSSIVVRETAERYKELNQEASSVIQDDTYVDDITTGRDEMSEVVSLKEGITKILDKGGLHVKGFVTSGEASEEAISLLGSGDVSRVLGVTWNPTKDVFSITVKINISKKYRGVRKEPDLTFQEIPRLLTIKLTRRIVQGIVYSIYDIYGLVAPITIPLKIELRNLFRKDLNLKWDDPIPEDMKAKWVQMLQVVKSVEPITFRRCIKPDAPTIGKPILIVCNDGSSEAMCATAHVRWELSDGSFACYLYSSKTRVAPLNKESIPKIEMQSTVIAVRLRESIVEHSKLEFEEVVHVLDSTCTLATFHKDTTALKEYMSNRCAEVLSKSDLEEWQHIESKKNISDLATRQNARVEDVSENSDWQRGSSWMLLPKDQWPTTKDVKNMSVPSEALINHAAVALAASTDNIIPLFNFTRFLGRSYDFLLHVVARLINTLRSRSLKGLSAPLLASTIIEAEKFCIKASMTHTKQEFDAGKLRSLRPLVDAEGVINVNSRAGKEMKQHYGNETFPILTTRDPLAQIWMQHVHNEDHSGITKTVAKSRRKFWIIRGRKLASKVKSSCYECRRLDKALAEQQMAPLPDSRLQIAPTFYTTSLDLFGPIEIRDTVKQRSRKKVWGIIFSCTVSRAVYIDLTEDYSTDSILQTLRRFVSIRGCPGEVQSDQGSQLVAAAKDIAQLVENWDWKPIHEWAANKRIKWNIAPAEGQHQNGLSESLVKLTKRSIENKIKGTVLTFSQLQTVFFEIANIMNSRPLGIISGSDPECPSPITPNDLLLGRATSDVPQGPFDQNDSPKNLTRKFRFLQDLVKQWWESWYYTVFPSLVPCYKWLQRHRNVKVDDVCLIRYRKEIRSTYRLGRVMEVKCGDDGLVRTVTLKYKLPNEKVFRFVSRPIHGICVIVPVEEQDTTKPPSKPLDPKADVFTPHA